MANRRNPKRSAAEVAEMIIAAEFGDQSDIEELSDEDDEATFPEIMVEVGVGRRTSDVEAEYQIVEEQEPASTQKTKPKKSFLVEEKFFSSCNCGRS